MCACAQLCAGTGMQLKLSHLIGVAKYLSENSEDGQDLQKVEQRKIFKQVKRYCLHNPHRGLCDM